MLLYYLGLSITSMSLKDDLTSCLQQEAVILLLGSVQIFAANQINFDKKGELETNILSSTCIATYVCFAISFKQLISYNSV